MRMSFCRQMVLGAWFFVHAAVTYAVARHISAVLQLLPAQTCQTGSEVPTTMTGACEAANACSEAKVAKLSRSYSV